MLNPFQLNYRVYIVKIELNTSKSTHHLELYKNILVYIYIQLLSCLGSQGYQESEKNKKIPPLHCPSVGGAKNGCKKGAWHPRMAFSIFFFNFIFGHFSWLLYLLPVWSKQRALHISRAHHKQHIIAQQIVYPTSCSF